MHGVKKRIKKLLPASVRQAILNKYHLMEAVAANVYFGFPTRGIKVIMITGTNGKTTVASLVGEMLERAGHKVGINTTAFYKVAGEMHQKKGARTLEDVFVQQKMFAQMRQAGCEYIVLEATSQGLDQNRLWGVDCDVAVFTNLTQDHLDYHGTMLHYANAKAKLFAADPRIIILNSDDKWFNFFDKYQAKEEKVTYGVAEGATLRITKTNLKSKSTEIILGVKDDGLLELKSQLTGNFNVYNVAAAASVGYCLGLSKEKIINGIAGLQNVPGRLERVPGAHQFEVIVDYAHTPDALENVLSTLRSLTKKQLILVFGATGDRDRTKRPIMGEVAVKYADKIFLTDEETFTEEAAPIRAGVLKGIKKAGGEGKTTEIADRRTAMEQAILLAKKGDIVVVTGMGHEQARNMSGKEIPWNDTEVAKEILKKR